MTEPEHQEQAAAEAGAEAPAESPSPTPAATETRAPELGVVRDVQLRLTVEVGATTMAVGQVMELEPGAVVELDRDVGDPADLLVNGKKIGRAEVTVEDERLAIRVVDLVSDDATGS